MVEKIHSKRPDKDANLYDPNFVSPSTSEMNNAVDRSVQSTIRSTILINGGASVAVLGFIGATFNASQNTALAAGLAKSLLAFTAGVFFGCITFYFVTHWIGGRGSAQANAEDLNIINLDEETKSNAIEGYAQAARYQKICIILSRISLLTSYLCFIVGCLLTYISITKTLTNIQNPPQEDTAIVTNIETEASIRIQSHRPRSPLYPLESPKQRCKQLNTGKRFALTI